MRSPLHVRRQFSPAAQRRRRAVPTTLALLAVMAVAILVALTLTGCGGSDPAASLEDKSSQTSSALTRASSLPLDPPPAAPPDPSSPLAARGIPASPSAGAAILAELEEASRGLLFVSESDFPFRVLEWNQPGGVLTAPAIAALTGHSAAPIEERTLEEFFAAAIRYHPGQSAEERVTVRRYRKLVKLLQSRLAAPRVYRFGSVQLHAYVVGVTCTGDWVGLSTIQIET